MKLDPKIQVLQPGQLDQQRVDRLAAQKGAEGQKLEELAQAFESLFVKMLLDRMPEEDPEGIMSSGFGGSIWKDMLHGEYANRAAGRMNFGIADAIIRQMSHASTAPATQPLETAQVSSPFGMRADPISGETRHHGGLDLAAPLGSPVRGVLPGRVVTAGPAGNYGNLVEIRHPDGRNTRYAHLDQIRVEVGQQVSQGQVIGTVGQTGRTTGPHLHFELRDGDKVIDPRHLLGPNLDHDHDSH